MGQTFFFSGVSCFGNDLRFTWVGERPVRALDVCTPILCGAAMFILLMAAWSRQPPRGIVVSVLRADVDSTSHIKKKQK